MDITPLAELVRRRIIASATSPFGHADYPLEHTLDHRGDPGLFGPGSASWKIIGDVSAFAGGIRALLIQAAHPEVVAGVEQHSRYREDPLGRLSRTSAYVTATTYGALPEVDEAIAFVGGAHTGVSGVSHRGRHYAATNPAHASWVHNVLTDSFLQTYRRFGRDPVDQEEADRFVAEQATIGAMMLADDLPRTAGDLADWVAGHPALGRSPGMTEAVGFLSDPPLSTGQRAGYRLLLAAAVSTIPSRIVDILGVPTRPGQAALGAKAIDLLRWALGSSPSWHLALIRTGAEIPDGLFTQRLVIDLPEPG